MTDGLDSRLVGWNSIQSGYEGQGLLIGNGASVALWDGFAYDSLYDEAVSNREGHRLTQLDQQVFKSLGTRNFEEVLGAVGMARLVAYSQGQPTRYLTDRYKSIQKALIDAVIATHVPWHLVPSRTLTKIRTALEFYDCVFSTNYDLVVYWALMSREGGARFVDFFLWSYPFDATDDWTWASHRTKVFYLHGGIHLYRRLDGGTIKRKAQSANLLASFARPLPNTVPLFISEGSHKDKMAAIHRNDYLSFAFDRLARHSGRLVLFGHSLGPSDQHLVDALNRIPNRKIAVGVLRTTHAQIVRSKAHFHHHLPDAELSFFDAATHPLGDASLKVPRS